MRVQASYLRHPADFGTSSGGLLGTVTESHPRTKPQHCKESGLTLKLTQGLLVIGHISRAEADEGHLLDFRVGLQEIHRRLECYATGLVLWIPVHSGTDRRKCDTCYLILHCHLETVSVASCQQFGLTFAATVPDRTDSMDDVLGRELIASCDLGLARLAAAEGPALFEKLWASSPVDTAVYTTSAQQASIRCVDDGIQVERGDVTSLKLNSIEYIAHNDFKVFMNSLFDCVQKGQSLFDYPIRRFMREWRTAHFIAFFLVKLSGRQVAATAVAA